MQDYAIEGLCYQSILPIKRWHYESEHVGRADYSTCVYRRWYRPIMEDAREMRNTDENAQGDADLPAASRQKRSS